MTPLLARGYVLTYDMVFVPRLELTRSLLGLGTAVARAVPGDLLVALASRLVPADLVQKLILLGIVVSAGIGAARLTPTTRPAAKGAAAALYAWNPFVYERLVMGHWGLLVSYAALPFVARAGIDLRVGVRGSVRRLILTLAVAAAASPPGGLIAAGVALCVVAAPSRPGGGRGTVDSRRPPLPRSATLPLRGPARRAAASGAAGEPSPSPGPTSGGPASGPAQAPPSLQGTLSRVAVVLGSPWW